MSEEKVYTEQELKAMADALLAAAEPEKPAKATKKRAARAKKEAQPVPVGNRVTYVLGSAVDRLRGVKEDGVSYVSEFAALYEEFTRDRRKVTRSMSFGLLLFCIGLLVTLIYLLY